MEHSRLEMTEDEWSIVAKHSSLEMMGVVSQLCKCAKSGADIEYKKRAKRLGKQLGLRGCQNQVVEEVILRRRSIYLAGKAGAGKSFTIKKVIEHLFRKGVGVLLTAPTGCAADRVSISKVHLNAATIHSTFNIKSMKRQFAVNEHFIDATTLNPDDEARFGDEFENANKPGHFPTAVLTPRHKKLLRLLDVLVIDEISMVTPDLLEVLDFTLRWVKGRPKTQFGGCQLLFSGDFSQLTGIKVRTNRPDSAEFCFQTRQWKCLKAVVLDEVIRTKNAKHVHFLDRARDANVTFEDCDGIYQLSCRDDSDAPVSIFPRNSDCERVNTERFRALAGRESVFLARPEYVMVSTDPVTIWPMEVASKRMSRPLATFEMPFADPVRLKVGCRVRATKNVYASHKADEDGPDSETDDDELDEEGRSVHSRAPTESDLVSASVDRFNVNPRSMYAIHRPRRVVTAGSLGTVTRIASETVHVRWDEDSSGKSRIVPRAYKRKLQHFKYDDEHPVYTVSSFLPLAHGYAFTVHKAQGASINTRVDIDPCSWPKCYGSAYTALSRATNIANVRFIRRPYPTHFETHPAALAYNKQLYASPNPHSKKRKRGETV